MKRGTILIIFILISNLLYSQTTVSDWANTCINLLDKPIPSDFKRLGDGSYYNSDGFIIIPQNDRIIISSFGGPFDDYNSAIELTIMFYEYFAQNNWEYYNSLVDFGIIYKKNGLFACVFKPSLRQDGIVMALISFSKNPINFSTRNTQSNTINLEKDDPNTLIGSTYTQFKIFGLSVNMTHEQVQTQINSDPRIIGLDDRNNSGRIYVYDARNRKYLLYLIWNPGEDRMSFMTVFNDCKNYLSPSFRRLLTLEAIDTSSSFISRFLGNSNRNGIGLDIPMIGTKYTIYYYDSIGIQITHRRSSSTEDVVFSFGRRD
jgi:hypothetical protein